MNVRELPRKWTLTNGATAVMKITPNMIIITKWAVLPRKSPSSSMRQYRTFTDEENTKQSMRTLSMNSARTMHSAHRPLSPTHKGTYQEIHMEQKINRKHPKEQVGRQQSPYLPLEENQIKVEIQGEGTDNVQGASCRGEERSGEVETGDNGNVHPPTKHLQATNGSSANTSQQTHHDMKSNPSPAPPIAAAPPKNGIRMYQPEKIDMNVEGYDGEKKFYVEIARLTVSVRETQMKRSERP
ncbi:hypothetical protein HJC23_007676 [Cyclotella cryptica]|uniref:Uncharacterized protein n=1 Tax=Cyclotella cryptica TaxID=29204 RepID=A0ABD3PRE9_9STRA